MLVLWLVDVESLDKPDSLAWFQGRSWHLCSLAVFHGHGVFSFISSPSSATVQRRLLFLHSFQMPKVSRLSHSRCLLAQIALTIIPSSDVRQSSTVLSAALHADPAWVTVRCWLTVHCSSSFFGLLAAGRRNSVRLILTGKFARMQSPAHSDSDCPCACACCSNAAHQSAGCVMFLRVVLISPLPI